jgi:adenosylcobinamide-GDP ribazoletransferase
VIGWAGWRASLVLAARFLTIVPIPGCEAGGPGALGRAAWWFPAIGLALGGGLMLADRLLSTVVPPLLSAGLVVAVWKVSTGGIHLDGLVDCLDGLAGVNAERTLAIMRDSRIGVFGALGLVLCLLIACAALSGTPAAARASILLLAPAVGRLIPLLVGPRVRPATPGRGLGAAFLAALPRAAGPVWLAVLLVLAWLLLGPTGAALAAGALVAGAAGVIVFARRLGGLTGDVLGTGVELSELGVLVLGAACAHRNLI